MTFIPHVRKLFLNYNFNYVIQRRWLFMKLLLQKLKSVVRISCTYIRRSTQRKSGFGNIILFINFTCLHFYCLERYQFRRVFHCSKQSWNSCNMIPVKTSAVFFSPLPHLQIPLRQYQLSSLSKKGPDQFPAVFTIHIQSWLFLIFCEQTRYKFYCNSFICTKFVSKSSRVHQSYQKSSSIFEW